MNNLQPNTHSISDQQAFPFPQTRKDDSTPRDRLAERVWVPPSQNQAYLSTVCQLDSWWLLLSLAICEWREKEPVIHQIPPDHSALKEEKLGMKGPAKTAALPKCFQLGHHYSQADSKHELNWSPRSCIPVNFQSQLLGNLDTTGPWCRMPLRVNFLNELHWNSKS